MTMNDLLIPSLSRTSVPASLASSHVFIVEKNPSIAEMITTVLTLAGYCPTKGIGELSALSQISPTNPPALILLDISLPHEACSKILTDAQAQCMAIGITPPPIIILTTSPSIRNEVEAIGYRALLKPFHVQDLMQAVHEALRLPLLRRKSL
jgi:DNA-binding response OmpR family regulator